jgi:hypothetical protein
VKSVAILGCGPAGMMVAHAAVLSGWDFRIYSRKVKSPLYGAQYLHQHIPGLTLNPAGEVVRYRLTGSPEQYRRKVYGDEWDGTTSPEDFMETHFAWDLRLAYDNMWADYQAQIWEVNLQAIPDVYHEVQKGHDLVISTVPRKIWAQPGDVFQSTKIWALGDTELPRVDKPFRPEPFTVTCDGRPHIPWYRVSNIFGHCTMEWPWLTGVGNLDCDLIEPPVPGASLVEKPLCHNSTAASDFIHLGRYGAWQKGILTSDVFFQAYKIFAEDAMDKITWKTDAWL